MTARFLAHLDDADMAYRYGFGLELPPAHIVDELRACWWFWRRHGFHLPAQRRVILHPGKTT